MSMQKNVNDARTRILRMCARAHCTVTTETAAFSLMARWLERENKGQSRREEAEGKLVDYASLCDDSFSVHRTIVAYSVA